jgi:hypothetical protein
MNTPLQPKRKKLEFKLTVSIEAQGRELEAAWRETIAGRQLRTDVLERDRAAITPRAMVALEIIEAAIRENPAVGHARRLVRFLLGIYNGYDYPFDVTDLRALDTRPANACLDYLNYDCLGIKEVHRDLSGGDRKLHERRADCGTSARALRGERQEAALAQLLEKADLTPRELLDKAVDVLADQYRQKSGA